VRWRFRARDGAVVELRPRARFRANDPRVALEAARQGLGIARVPADLLASQGGELVRLSVDFGEPEPGDLFAVYPAGPHVPQRVRLAVDWVAREGGPRRAR
jgi:LysR family transcriptional regulator AphB